MVPVVAPLVGGINVTIKLRETIDRVSSDLQLAGPDAAVYVHLCAAGPAKVSDLAEALHIHRNDVYRTAERLVERGLVQATMERPVRFVAVSPEVVFDHEIDSRLATVENLRRSRSEIVSLIEQLSTLAPAAPKGVYKIVQGRPAIFALRDEMLSRAEASAWWASTHPATLAQADVTGALDRIAERASQGISVRALVHAGEGWAARLEPILRQPAAAARAFSTDAPVRFFIVDGKELLMWVVNDPSDSLYSPDEVAIYTTAAGFVSAQQQFFETAWSASPSLSLP